MPIAEHIQEFSPDWIRRENDRTSLYWIRDGKICYCNSQVRGADVETFRFYLGGFAKDSKNCYVASSRLKGANPATFRALNLCYATNGQNVWTIGGSLKDVNAAQFAVCDDGVRMSGTHEIPTGFGKDDKRVYYYDYDGKPNWVKKADAATFVSLNDGDFAKDVNCVFCGQASLPKANVETWAKLGGLYSADSKRIFYCNREIKEADLATFQVVQPRMQLARDKNNLYWTDRIVDAATFSELAGDK